MKKTILASVLALTAAFSVSAAQTDGPYVGVQLGKASSEASYKGYSAKDDAGSVGLIVGYEKALTENVAVDFETGYIDAGTHFGADVTTIPMLVKLNISLTDNVSLVPFMGGHRWSVENDLGSDSGIGLAAGVEGRYDFTSQLAGKIGIQQMSGDSTGVDVDMDTVYATVAYKF